MTDEQHYEYEIWMTSRDTYVLAPVVSRERVNDDDGCFMVELNSLHVGEFSDLPAAEATANALTGKRRATSDIPSL
jgi:hypothetical protein